MKDNVIFLGNNIIEARKLSNRELENALDRIHACFVNCDNNKIPVPRATIVQAGILMREHQDRQFKDMVRINDLMFGGIHCVPSFDNNVIALKR